MSTAMNGRPTKYKKKYDDEARKLCLLGCTDVELAKYFEISESTLNNWKVAHPSFMESIKLGKESADSNVAEKLYQRAIGYWHPETKVFNNQGEIVTYEVMKHCPPDPTAMMFWLKNRQPSKFRDRKATLPEVKFDYDESLSLKDQAHQIIKAASQGIISVDVANSLVSSMSAMLKIEEITTIKEAVEDVKSILGESE